MRACCAVVRGAVIRHTAAERAMLAISGTPCRCDELVLVAVLIELLKALRQATTDSWYARLPADIDEQVAARRAAAQNSASWGDPYRASWDADPNVLALTALETCISYWDTAIEAVEAVLKVGRLLGRDEARRELDRKDVYWALDKAHHWEVVKGDGDGVYATESLRLLDAAFKQLEAKP